MPVKFTVKSFWDPLTEFGIMESLILLKLSPAGWELFKKFFNENVYFHLINCYYILQPNKHFFNNNLSPECAFFFSKLLVIGASSTDEHFKSSF